MTTRTRTATDGHWMTRFLGMVRDGRNDSQGTGGDDRPGLPEDLLAHRQVRPMGVDRKPVPPTAPTLARPRRGHPVRRTESLRCRLFPVAPTIRERKPALLTGGLATCQQLRRWTRTGPVRVVSPHLHPAVSRQQRCHLGVIRQRRADRASPRRLPEAQKQRIAIGE
jgi:hypothetical protein